MIEKLLYLIYTHKEYDDVLQIQLKRVSEFFPEVAIAVCSNDIEFIKEKYGKEYKFYDLYPYEDSAVYGERVRSVLEKVTHPYVLFNHELNILTKNVDAKEFDRILELMETSNIDQVRVFLSGIPNPILDDAFLHPISSYYKFSCNSAIWKTPTLYDIFNFFKETQFRKFESDEIQSFVSQFRNFYVSSKDDFQVPGLGQYYSHFFPVIHVTHGGKWVNVPFHNLFLDKYFEEFNIDKNKRGTCY